MTDYQKISEELISRGHGKDSPIYKAVLDLCFILDAQKLPDEGLKRLVVDQFHSLNTRENLRISSMTREGSKWGQFRLGNVPIGAVVRVKDGAFSSEPGQRFNGLVGRFVAGRGGRAVVRFIGHQDGIGHYLDPLKLEVLQSTDKDI